MIVGVADVIAHHGALAANVTDVRHGTTLLKLFNYIKKCRESKRGKDSFQFSVFSYQLKLKDNQIVTKSRKNTFCHSERSEESRFFGRGAPSE
jgi:hypothetical protein